MFDKVEEILEGLKKGDPIDVYWMDASETELNRLTNPLPNEAVETRQREFGEFLCVQVGKFSRLPHLIYVMKWIDDRPRISSIPLPLVYRIVRGEMKESKKAGPSISMPLRPIQSHRKRMSKLIDGSVKFWGKVFKRI